MRTFRESASGTEIPAATGCPWCSCMPRPAAAACGNTRFRPLRRAVIVSSRTTGEASARTVIDPAGVQPGTGSDDLLALLDHLRVDRFHVVGTAAGGIVALDFAVSFPQRLRSLVLANTIGGVQDPEYLDLGRRLRPAPQFNALPPEFRELGPSYRAANPGGTERWKELEHTNRSPGPPLPAQTMRNQLTFSLLEGIKVPTLLLTGDADLYTPPAVLRLFAARITGSESVIVPEAGHSAYWEQPEIFNRTVLAFIRKQ